MEFEGKLTLLDFKARVKIVPVGGTMTANADNIEVRGADEVLVIIAGSTNYDPVAASYTSDASAMRAKGLGKFAFGAACRPFGADGPQRVYNRRRSQYRYTGADDNAVQQTPSRPSGSRVPYA